MQRPAGQEQEEQRSELNSDSNIMEENNQIGFNVNQIPIFPIGKSVMSNKSILRQCQGEKNENIKSCVNIQQIRGDCDSNIPTSPPCIKSKSENSRIQEQPHCQEYQIINLNNIEQKTQKQEDLKYNCDGLESLGNVEIPQECKSVSNSFNLRKQEISRALAFYQKDVEQKLEDLQAKEKEEAILQNNQNIGPFLYLHQNNPLSSTESNCNQSSSLAPRQTIYQMNPIISIQNQPSSQQHQLIGSNQNGQQQSEQQQAQLNQQQPRQQDQILRGALQDIQFNGFANNEQIGIGYFQLRHMLKILRAIMIMMGLTGLINLFLMVMSIVGLKPHIPSECGDAKNFFWGVLIPISILSGFIAFLDFYGVFILCKREYLNLTKKQLNNMRLKVSDLQNCHNILKALHLKYPWMVVPQFFLKANCKFFKYKNESQLGKCEAQCIICYMDYQIDEDLATLPCKAGHIFHKNCVGYWLEINQCCPTCKQTL